MEQLDLVSIALVCSTVIHVTTFLCTMRLMLRPLLARPVSESNEKTRLTKKEARV